MQGLVVEVGRDDCLRLVAEDRLVELADRRGLAGHQLVPDRRAGSTGERGTDVRGGLPDAEDRTSGVGGDGEPARLTRVERPHGDCAAAGPDGLRREIRVVGGQVGRPGHRQMAVGRQLSEARHHLSVEQRPDVRTQLVRTRHEFPAEQIGVEVLGRAQAVHDQTHPAGCSGRTRGGSLGHRHSLLGPAGWWPYGGNGAGALSCGTGCVRPVQMLAPPGARCAPAAPHFPDLDAGRLICCGAPVSRVFRVGCLLREDGTHEAHHHRIGIRERVGGATSAGAPGRTLAARRPERAARLRGRAHSRCGLRRPGRGTRRTRGQRRPPSTARSGRIRGGDAPGRCLPGHPGGRVRRRPGLGGGPSLVAAALDGPPGRQGPGRRSRRLDG